MSNRYLEKILEKTAGEASMIPKIALGVTSVGTTLGALNLATGLERERNGRESLSIAKKRLALDEQRHANSAKSLTALHGIHKALTTQNA